MTDPSLPPARSWYFYQKTKNYRVLWAGIKGGLRTGGRLALWTGAFLTLEETVDSGLRSAVQLGQPTASDDVLGTKAGAGALAGVAMAGAASWWCASSLPRRSLSSALSPLILARCAQTASLVTPSRAGSRSASHSAASQAAPSTCATGFGRGCPTSRPERDDDLAGRADYEKMQDGPSRYVCHALLAIS